ncbi:MULTISPECIES: threonine/serine exporter family protein [Clostridium]|uniref:Threonine/serine exporter family protein n=1 Tax=Clostridium botulinum TaxID=1491 RepID=A0A6B4FFM7_CLOBO|nr:MULTISPECIES: threonine/serine exporter family protein [Clostridium]EES50784.1 membrane spanning protein [Clostridium botulinum E1 str. 'BoNT E Beluga']MBY6761539.1 threonine/serine exporter family protein [Clostridium botulinum]MBY6920129.1 threonine/serine exporter family protein [Clostridium botulinum]MBY7023672.1 threonine/serine exporter family protein [Clostridium botulinum]MCR1131020.1 threonine/serine exporter family protein [Clostridium botulinum]
MDLNKLLQVSTFAGKIMLESGAETYRVEETVCRICTSFGVDQADSFVIPTGIMVSISHGDEVASLVKRVTSRGVDLNKIDKINDLARKTQIELLSIDDFNKELIEISKGDRYSNSYTFFWSAISAGSFAMLFGGNVKDFLVATLIGLIIKIVITICQRLSINEFFINTLCGSICAFLAIIFIKLNIGSNLDKIIIGSIMLLVPGLTITNAIRDTIAGDLLSGMTKALEAFLVAVSIAVGTGGVLSIFINTLGGM